MVIIGGMRSLLGPALGALFYILFREYLSIWTPNWLLFFGLLFVGFIVFSPSGLVGRLAAHRPSRCGRRSPKPPRWPDAVDRAGRAAARRSCARAASRWRRARGARSCEDPSAASTRSSKRASSCASASLHALIGPNGAGKTTLFNLVTGMFAPDRGAVLLHGATDHRAAAASRSRSRASRRSFQITNLFPGVSIAGEPAARGAGARRRRASTAGATRERNERVHAHARASSSRYLGLSGHRAVPRRARFRTAASACSTWGSRSQARRACCCSTSRSPGLPPPSANASAR